MRPLARGRLPSRALTSISPAIHRIRRCWRSRPNVVASVFAMDIEHVLRRHGGSARWKELDALGFTRETLTAAVREARVIRVHRGCYALPDAAPANVLATVFRAQPTCLSWCERVGLPLASPVPTVHLGVPQSRAIGQPRERPVAGVTLHRHGSYPDDFPVAHLDVTALCSSPIAQLALIDAALARGLVVMSDLRDLRHGDQRRREWLCSNADARSASLAETYARVALTEAGLEVEPQARIGATGCVDLLVEGVVVVETDGFAYHSDRNQFERDRRRDRDLTLAGFTPLRFTYHDVVSRTSEMVGDVVAVAWRETMSTGDQVRADHARPPARSAARPVQTSLRTRLNEAARVSQPLWWR